MKKLVFLLFLIPSTLLANEITDYKCQRLESKGTSLMQITQRCENAEIVCYEKAEAIWCYKK